MMGTKSERAIIEGNEEIGGRKRVGDDMDTRPTKMEKADGDEAAGCRNLGTKLEILTSDRAEEEGEELKEKINGIRELLEDDPKKLRNKDVEDVILHFDVDEIISLALKSDRANRGAFNDYTYLEGGSSFVPSPGKVLGLLTLMLLGGIEKVKEVDLFILYQNLPKLSFAQLLLSALDSYSLFDKADEHVMICQLCYALPWKLFTHIMYHKTSLASFKRSEEEEEESNDGSTMQKEAAESCEICCGKGKHSGVFSYHCSFWDYVPSGLTVGPSHSVCCRECNDPKTPDDFVKCSCGSRVRQAVPRSMILWEI